MERSKARIVATLSTTVVLLTVTARPVAAVHDIVGCKGGDLSELLMLIHNVAELGFIFGGSIAVVALSYAGIVFMWGSEDAKRRAKRRVQRGLIGVIIVYSSPLVVTFLVSQFSVCNGGV
jgi:hypothetical protein